MRDSQDCQILIPRQPRCEMILRVSNALALSSLALCLSVFPGPSRDNVGTGGPCEMGFLSSITTGNNVPDLLQGALFGSQDLQTVARDSEHQCPAMPGTT
jgi:hypothetical protein